jgi:hypothetical protein
MAYSLIVRYPKGYFSVFIISSAIINIKSIYKDLSRVDSKKRERKCSGLCIRPVFLEDHEENYNLI